MLYLNGLEFWHHFRWDKIFTLLTSNAGKLNHKIYPAMLQRLKKCY